MKREKIKNHLDFIPFIILIGYAIALCWTIFTTDFVLTWRNIVGLFILPVNFLVLRWHHKIGVLALGLTLFFGLLSILSYVPGITKTTVTLGLNDSLTSFSGQPIYLLWLLIHFIFSGRNYVGIVTKEYWTNMFSGSHERC